MKKELVFYGLLDFYPKREEIRKNYEMLTLDEIITYKMYVYSLPFEEEYIKDLIWEYLNGWREGVFELAKKYRIKKEKNQQRQKMYDEEKRINEIQNNVETNELERDYWAV